MTQTPEQKKAEAEAKKKAEAEAKKRAEAEAKKRAEAADKKKADAEAKMAWRITAKVNGFRRCGIAHPGDATDYPADQFSKKQIEILQDEPNLVVEKL